MQISKENTPKVSVCMITYGHEKYIREAIEGVLMQECDFEVELIVANDCSPDNTDAVIQDIIKNHPRGSWIKYFNHSENLGMMPNFIFALKQCKGEYIALCEGDDYWTDKFKLIKQVDFLDSNSDYVLSFHPVKILKVDGSLVDDFITNLPENYELYETLAIKGNYIHTPSVVYRNVIKEYPFEFQITPVGDYFLYLMLAPFGKLKIMDQIMGVYRYGVGIHSSNTSLKTSENNLKFFSCILSYISDDTIKRHLLSRNLIAISNYNKNNRSGSTSKLIKVFRFIFANYRKPDAFIIKANRYLKK